MRGEGSGTGGALIPDDLIAGFLMQHSFNDEQINKISNVAIKGL
jgi:hypothetical protein